MGGRDGDCAKRCEPSGVEVSGYLNWELLYCGAGNESLSARDVDFSGFPDTPFETDPDDSPLFLGLTGQYLGSAHVEGKFMTVIRVSN